MIIGREKEQNIFKAALSDSKSHFIAIYGRRRVGKTFLVKEYCDNRFTFQHTGLSEGKIKIQIQEFVRSLEDYGYIFEKTPSSWLDAFAGLKKLICNSNEKKKVIFIDELSWMDTQKSDLIIALENFWNGFASARNDVVLIVCASATSWMLSKVVHSKGGLYNRLTEQIHLQPFTLKECEEYVKSAGLVLNRDQILQYYMVFGGVPYYWNYLKKGRSVQQIIDDAIFAEEAPLKREFNYLYASIFKNPEIHLRIIETLASKKVGMTRDEIIEYSKLTNSGDLTKKLEELENCGFIRKFNAFGMAKKNAVYQLMDCFTLFYYQFMKTNPTDEHFWTNQMNTPAINTWKGLAFERVCLMHIRQMKEKLGISGVLTDVNSWYCKADADKGLQGSQIDLLIARNDKVINLCEMKYSENDYALTAKVEKSIRNKISDLQIYTTGKYAIHPTLVTPRGLVDNSYSMDIQAVITLDDLFR